MADTTVITVKKERFRKKLLRFIVTGIVVWVVIVFVCPEVSGAVSEGFKNSFGMIWSGTKEFMVAKFKEIILEEMGSDWNNFWRNSWEPIKNITK